MRFRLVSILSAGVLLLVVGLAEAAKPKGSYRFSAPSSADHPSVYFVTSSNGKKLLQFSAGMALKCKVSACGGFGGVRSFTRASVKVSNKGTFKVTAKILAVNNKKLGTQTVTGKFVSPTKVKGKVTTHANLGQYKGVTKSYTATGIPTAPTKPTAPTTSFKGCSGTLLGTATQFSPPFPYVVRFNCTSSSGFSSFQISTNRTISSVGSASNGWSCSASSSTSISCASQSGAKFAFPGQDDLPIFINLQSTETPCGSPGPTGEVSIAGDSSSIQLTPQLNNCP
jgi:hypothetical protein